MYKWLSIFFVGVCFLLSGYYALDKKQFHASVPQPPSPAKIDLIDLKPQATACMRNAIIEPRSHLAQIEVATYQHAGAPLRVGIYNGTSSQHIQVPGSYQDNGIVSIPVEPPKKQLLATFCIQNVGTQKVALYESVVQQYPSPVKTFVDGQQQPGNFTLQFIEKSSTTRISRLTDILQRIETFRPSIVGKVTLSILLILLILFAPLLIALLVYRANQEERTQNKPVKQPVSNNPAQSRLPKNAVPVLGPSMIGSDHRRFLRLTWTMAITQFKLRFYGSALGYLWQLMRPLALFGVLYVVFTQFVKVGERVPFYEVSLLLGIVLFVFFSEATTGSVRCLVDREALIRKVDFPRLAVPCSVVLTATINLFINLIVVAIFAFASGVHLHSSILQAFPVIAMFLVFVSGLSIGLSALYLRYRDVNPIWEVVQQMVLYGTPIFYTIETVKTTNSEAAKWLMLSPFATVIQQLRHTCIDPSAPSASAAAGGWNGVFAAGGITVAVFVVGFWLFYRESPRIAEEL